MSVQNGVQPSSIQSSSRGSVPVQPSLEKSSPGSAHSSPVDPVKEVILIKDKLLSVWPYWAC